MFSERNIPNQCIIVNRFPIIVSQMTARYFVLLGMGFWSCLLLADDSPDFNQKIRPILAAHCLACHGPDESTREADLRLDRFENATAESESGEKPIVVGNPAISEMIRRVSLPVGHDERMPPEGQGLSKAEILLLEDWITAGARFQKHWAFESPKSTPLPPVKNWNRVENSIDQFVLARLESMGIAPAPQADRYRLVRRVYLDLTGLPPSMDQVDRFVNDTSDVAYESMVERVLASPRFGERWARVWLDLARYADSQGYAQDSPRSIYRYRDWVIDSINENKPFDQFTIEQIAGDMLENPTNEQILATAFHRNTMTNSEGGTDDEEFRTAAVVDRVNTTFQVWMGMTMGCAQCHTHKYDPITQEEYFQVFAILNQTEDADRGNESPLLGEVTRARRNRRDSIATQIKAIEKDLSIEAKKEKDEVALPSGKLKTRYVRVQGLGAMFLHLAEVEVFAGGKNVALSGLARQSTTAFAGPAKYGNDGNTNGDFQKQSVTHTAEETNPWWEVDLKQLQVVEKVVVWNRTDSNTGDRLKQFRIILLDEKRTPIWTLSTKDIPRPNSAFGPPLNSKDYSDRDRRTLLTLRKEWTSDLSPKEKSLVQLKKELVNVSKTDVSTPIMKQLAAAKQRTTKIHVRGDFRTQGDIVKPAVPQVFHEMDDTDGSPDRLDFAKWLVDRKNPITARVIVNRFWEQLFGTGIVETSEDFGTQGELPSHPLLLDHLAIEFMDNQWDVKRLLRKIVSSHTYRQSSGATPKIQELDPRNRLLSHGPRFRLSAEMIRDQALFASDSLSSKINGPSVRPPRPKLGLRAAFGGSTDWDPSPGEDAYRRGIYTTWRRTSPYPSMTTFDAPSREFCTLRRSRTNTPLQALVTMNDPVFVDASRSLARRTLDVASDDSARIVFAFRKVLARPPFAAELQLLTVALADIRKKVLPEDAKSLAGGAKGAFTPTEFAHWIVICNVILNLDEALSRP